MKIKLKKTVVCPMRHWCLYGHSDTPPYASGSGHQPHHCSHFTAHEFKGSCLEPCQDFTRMGGVPMNCGEESNE